MSTEVDPKLADRFTLKAFVEACLVLEEGIAGVRDVDLGMMMGTGMIPGPFARADLRGLDDVLAALEQAEEDWGEHFEPPLILRRLVAQGRLGAKTGQGFYPYPQPEAGYEQAPVKLDRRGDVAVLWLDNPPANSLSPAVIEALERPGPTSRRSARAMIVASPNPALFCAGADIKALHEDGRGRRGRELLDRAHGLFRAWERSRVDDDRRRQRASRSAAGARSRWPATSASPAFSASFGQPEIALGIIPGFGGTQRLPRLVGPAKALEMNTIGEPISAGEAYEFGLVNTRRAGPRAVRRRAQLGAQVRRPGAGRARADQARLARGRPRRGHRGREGGFIEAFTSEDAREGISAFLGKRTPSSRGK